MRRFPEVLMSESLEAYPTRCISVGSIPGTYTDSSLMILETGIWPVVLIGMSSTCKQVDVPLPQTITHSKFQIHGDTNG